MTSLTCPHLVRRISSSQAQIDEATRVEQENLDIKCLQLLRAIIHNEVVKLPDDWEENPLKHKRYAWRQQRLDIPKPCTRTWSNENKT